MPGCLSYVVARDPTDADAIWITEVWDARRATRRHCNCPRYAKPSSVAGR